MLAPDPVHPGHWLVEGHWFENGQLKRKEYSVREASLVKKELVPLARAKVAEDWRKNAPHLLDDIVGETQTNLRRSLKGQVDWMDQVIQDALTGPYLRQMETLQAKLDAYRARRGGTSFTDPECLSLFGQIESLKYAMEPFAHTERKNIEAFIADINDRQTALGAGQRKLAADIDQMLARKGSASTISAEDAALIERYKAAKRKPVENARRQLQNELDRLKQLNNGRDFSSVRTPSRADTRAAFPDQNPDRLIELVQIDPSRVGALSTEDLALIWSTLRRYQSAEAYAAAIKDPVRAFYLERLTRLRKIEEARNKLFRADH